MFASGVAAAVVLVALVPSDHAPVERMPGPPRDAGAATQAGDASRPGRGSDRARADGVARDGVESGMSDAPPRTPPPTAAGMDAAQLERMAAGYRDRILLRAIRKHGYRCDGIIDTQAGRADFVIWRVTCGSGRAYFVEVDAAGELAVEALYYGDPLGPAGPPRQAPETERRLVPLPEGP